MWRIRLLLLLPLLFILTAATCGEDGGDETDTPTAEAEATDTPEPEDTDTPEPDEPEATATPVPPTNTPAPVTNRKDCDAIRGTSYLSPDERTWFQANCITQIAPQPSGGGGGGGQQTSCHPSYTGACLDPNASDYDCAGGSGNGPLYTGPVQVVGPDVFDLDRDGDGQGCE